MFIFSILAQVPQGAIHKIKDANHATNFSIDANLSISQLLTNQGGGVSLINIIFFIIGLVFLVNTIIVASEYITSGGDQKRLQATSSRLTNSITGFIITLAAYLIVRLVTTMLGVNPLI